MREIIMAKKIVLTAGHSDKDPGAVNQLLGKTESDLMELLRGALSSKLRDAGYEVITDGTGTVNHDLNHAISLIKNHKPDIAIELHMNGSADPRSTGVETISLPKDKKLSQDISKAIADVLGDKIRGDKGWIDQSQSHRGKLGFVSAGGIIVETVFISNPDDLKEYEEKYWLVASAMADVIKKYLG